MSIPELNQALADNPGDWELRLSLVQALMAEGRHETAVEVVNQGEALPQEPGPWVAAAKTYAAVGAYEQAAALVATALEIDPEYEPAKAYRTELSTLAPQAPVVLTVDDLEDDEVPVQEVVPLLRKSDDASPMTLPKVAFSNHEMEALREAGEAARARLEAATRRDKFNSLAITILAHVAIFVALTLVVTQAPPSVPPKIVASAAAPSTTQETRAIIDSVRMNNNTTTAGTASSTTAVVPNIVSSTGSSSFAISSLDMPVSEAAVGTGTGTASGAAAGGGMGMGGIGGTGFNPSLNASMSGSSTSRMMFGQAMEMKGEVLGVILDVSGSMAEFLPAVVREVDKNFKNSPIVYVRNMLLSGSNQEGDIRLIVPEEVVPYDPKYKTNTPYWFLWHDLPRKAPQRYVDRLIETFKTRPNQFLVTSGWEGASPSTAINFLMEEKIDALYIFSDFEDYVDEGIATELGQKLGRKKIRTYVQPADKSSEFLGVMTKKISNKTLGRQMPSLVSLLRGSEETEVTSLMHKKREEDVADLAKLNVKLATPRPTLSTEASYSVKPGKDWKEIHRLSEPEYDAVFYGPEARVRIYLKDAAGQYIQNPIEFFYHSWKEIPDHPDPRYRLRTRKFLRLEEEPSFDGKEIVWKMVLEDEMKFRVHLYLGRKGMNATYVADILKDQPNDNAHIYFRIPALAQESKDRYYGYDFPAEGLKLDQVRESVKANEVIFNLPRAERESYIKQWAISGFDMGYNTRKYNELIRQLPRGIRDVVVQGPSFGARKFHARTTSSKIFLSGGSGRADIEPWEGYWMSLVRSRAERTKFTKTEAIEIQID
ncbi:MAG TPA: hypothetical protein PLA50_07455 [Bacteroidia bacterium]|nr:hypothetical protein [Bacteroidia bacterium]